MDSQNLTTSHNEKSLLINDWPLNLETSRKELKKAQKRLEQYKAALRLANVEIERRNRDIVTLTSFIYQAGRTATPGTLLNLALAQALKTIGAPMGAIVLIDTETKELTLAVHQGLTPELSQVLTGQQLGIGATALMPHLVSGTGALLEYHTADDEAEKLLLLAGKLTSLVSLPLQINPRLMGAFLLGLQGKRSFSAAELCFLTAISQGTATILESLRLREGIWHTAETLLDRETTDTKLQNINETDLNLDTSTPFFLPDSSPTIPQPAKKDLEQLLAAMMEAQEEVQQQNEDFQTLNTISKMMNRTLDLEEILQCTVDQTQAVLKMDAAWLYLVDDSNQLEMRAHTGLSEAYVRGMQRLKPGDGLEGQVIVKNKGCFVESISKDARTFKFWVDKEGFQALAAIPLASPEPEKLTRQTHPSPVGVLAIGSRTAPGHAWSTREMRLLTSIANQVALAINNAMLYAQVQDEEAGMRTGNEVLRTLNDMLIEKNVFLEGFIQEDLAPALTAASQALQRLQVKNCPTNVRKQDVAVLQKILTGLNKQTKEASDINALLDAELSHISSDKQGRILP
jgi:GAF domain-containing protein